MIDDDPYFDFSDMTKWPEWKAHYDSPHWQYEDTLLDGLHVEIMALPNLLPRPIVQATVFEPVTEFDGGRVTMRYFRRRNCEIVPYEGDDERDRLIATMKSKAQEYVAQYQSEVL